MTTKKTKKTAMETLEEAKKPKNGAANVPAGTEIPGIDPVQSITFRIVDRIYDYKKEELVQKGQLGLEYLYYETEVAFFQLDAFVGFRVMQDQNLPAGANHLLIGFTNDQKSIVMDIFTDANSAAFALKAIRDAVRNT